MKTGIYVQLDSARQAIEGALADPAIIRQLTFLGYDRKKIMEGKVLYEKVSIQQGLRESEETLQKEMTRRLHEEFEEGYQLYMRHIKHARLSVPPDRKLWNDLRLSGPRKRSIAGWQMQASAFYRNVEAVADLLAQQGITADELEQARAMTEAVFAAKVQQNKGKSNTQQARQQRDDAREELHQWMRKFIKAARYAFDENKQQLEALGIVVPS